VLAVPGVSRERSLRLLIGGMMPGDFFSNA
jgi:hypothetical protein